MPVSHKDAARARIRNGVYVIRELLIEVEGETHRAVPDSFTQMEATIEAIEYQVQTMRARAENEAGYEVGGNREGEDE